LAEACDVPSGYASAGPTSAQAGFASRKRRKVARHAGSSTTSAFIAQTYADRCAAAARLTAAP
jgi:hypothetical protein